MCEIIMVLVVNCVVCRKKKDKLETDGDNVVSEDSQKDAISDAEAVLLNR